METKTCECFAFAFALIFERNMDPQNGQYCLMLTLEEANKDINRSTCTHA